MKKSRLGILEMLTLFQTGDFNGFVKIGIEYADAICLADKALTESVKSLLKSFTKKKKLGFMEEDRAVESYFNFYNEILLS